MAINEAIASGRVSVHLHSCQMPLSPLFVHLVHLSLSIPPSLSSLPLFYPPLPLFSSTAFPPSLPSLPPLIYPSLPLFSLPSFPPSLLFHPSLPPLPPALPLS